MYAVSMARNLDVQVENKQVVQFKIDRQVFTKKTEASHLEYSTCRVVYILTSSYANFKSSFKPFQISKINFDKCIH